MRTSSARATRTLRLVTLAAAALVLRATASLGACPGGACSVPGGGSATSDCIVEYDGVMPNDPPTRPRGVLCTDGDLSCDTDGIANGACNFVITACLNNPDPRFPLCTAPTVASVVVKNRPPTSSSYNPQLDALQAAMQALVPTATNACTASLPITVPLRLRGGDFRANTVKMRSIAFSNAGVKDADRLKLKCLPSSTFAGPGTGFSRAEVATNTAQLIEGPLAFGRLGDIHLYNDKIQLIIQQPGRKAAAIDLYGGNIIDADRVRPDGTEHDHFGAWSPGINIENTANYTSVVVLNDGANGSPAVVRATGPDDLMDFVNGSTVVAGFGFAFPAGADDRDLPIDVQTDYILEAGKEYVTVETTLTNLSATAFTGTNALFFADYLNGSGQVDVWQPTNGFGEPLVTVRDGVGAYLPCSTPGGCDPQDMVAYVGIDGADGLSYGYIHNFNGTTTFSTAGVTVPLLGQEAVLTLIGSGAPNFPLQPAGNSGDSLTVTRYFAVADGGLESLARIRNEILGIATGTLAGTVTSGGQPVANARIAVTGTSVPGGLGAATQPTTNAVSHTRTKADGSYAIPLPAGSYTVLANVRGRLATTPSSAPVTIINGATTMQSFTVGSAGAIRVLVTDENSDPSPAKVNIVGFDPSPSPLNSQNILGLIRSTMGIVAEERKEGVTQGIADAIFAGKNGDTGVYEIEPGSYQVSISRGPRYSASIQNVTVVAGATTTVNAQIAKVVPTPGFVSGDFHVHGILSPDSEVTLVERVTTELAEGMDFFTPSEHEIRADYGPVVQEMGVDHLIATAISAEITTFDYGHFNSWPVTRDPSQVNGGTVDWGRAGVAPGQDFPSLGNYTLSPAEIYAAAHADPKPNLIQINHMRSHFNRDGLDIDTAEAGTGPPTSHVVGLTRRLDPLVTNYFDAGFDALEVWIGTDGRAGGIDHFLGENIGDWFNLLNQGIVAAGVTDSDTHDRRITNLNARSYVASAVTDPALLWGEDETLAQNVVMGHLTGTNGPFMTVTVTTPLGTAGLGVSDDTMVPTNNGTATVDVTVKSPMWAPFDRIEFYVNNAPQAYDHDANAGTRMRYRAIPDFVTNVVPSLIDDYPSIPGAKHWEATAQRNLVGLSQDTWVVVVVRGTDGVSAPLFPVIPNSLLANACSNNPCRSCAVDADCTGGGTCTIANQTLAEVTDTNLGQCGVTALAFSNPLFIDANQNTQYDPRGVVLTP